MHGQIKLFTTVYWSVCRKSDAGFLTTFNEFILTSTDPIVFSYPVLNPGGRYNVTTGIYNMPIDGNYEFMFYLLSYGDEIIGGFLNMDGAVVNLFIPNCFIFIK